ncbi:hypothetical protein PYCCODRAFT_1467799 [Trametes coccinea BRFM310]|uniref:F-box domain-containing protein n=1 Tax=Trametes coccinea (strain BRFM310) TaxID=1353009 RepID=A0A1Y2IMW3_TRAC3|nr:hypothetical protein PYCCODRAFT_1467799 [Trametes coccinea BRFM310]
MLTTIFRHAIDMASAPPAPPQKKRQAMSAGTSPATRTRTVLTLTHVCQHWREVLLKHPSFWSVISSKNMNAAETFLQRSGSHVSLVVHIDAIHPADQLIPPFLTEGGIQPRLREIHWTASASAGAPRKADYLLFPAPRLELLRLIGDTEDSERDEVYRNTPPILFAGHVPLLRTTYLGSIGWLPGNRFESLTYLCLFEINVEFPGFVRLLCDCPVLERLELSGIRVTAPPGRPPLPGLAIGQATLPKLRFFTFINMPTASVNDFLFYFASHRADISLDVVNVPHSPNLPVVDIKSLAPEATRAMNTVLLWYHNHDPVVEVHIYATGPGVDVALRSAPTELKTVNGALNLYTPVHWGLRQLYAVPLDSIRRLAIRQYHDGQPRARIAIPTLPSARDVRALIARMSGLEEVCLVRENVQLLFREAFSASADTALLPLRSEAPEWRLSALHVIFCAQAGVRQPDPDQQQLAVPDLSDILQVVGRLVFKISGPPEAYAGVLGTLRALQERWQEQVSIQVGDSWIRSSESGWWDRWWFAKERSHA